MLPRVPGSLRIMFAARLSQLAGQTGIDSQEQYGVQRFEAAGHTVVHVAADRKSGMVPPWKRKSLRPWVENPAKIAQYDAVGALSLDRLTRGDNKSTNEIEQWAWDNGKRLITTDGLYFPCEGEDGIRWDIAKRLAHAEWLRTSERYLRMHKYLRDNGHFVGRPPFGYDVVGVECGESPCQCKNDRKMLVPSPDESRIILELADRAISGAPLTELARWLDESGVPTSNKTTKNGWDPRIVSQILRSETLIGRRWHGQKNGRKLYRFEPIMERGEWKKLQGALDANSRRRGTVRQEPAMLTGIVHCGNCRRIMHFRRTPGQWNTPYVWTGYRCDGTPKQPSTCKNSPAAAEVEGWVNGWLTEPNGAFGYREIIETAVIPGNDHDDEIEDVETALADLDYDQPDFLDRQAELLAERKRLRELPAEPARVTERPTGVALAEYWPTLTAQEKRAYLLQADVRVYVRRTPKRDVWFERAVPLQTGVREFVPGSPEPAGLEVWIEGDPSKIEGALLRKLAA